MISVERWTPYMNGHLTRTAQVKPEELSRHVLKTATSKMCFNGLLFPTVYYGCPTKTIICVYRQWTSGLETIRSKLHLDRLPVWILPPVGLFHRASNDPTYRLTIYSRLRQFPLYTKTTPPAVLSNHFNQETFEKSQNYGKDKAKFSLFSGLFKQCIDSALLHYGIYAWSWDVAGRSLARFGYGSEDEVCFVHLFFST